MLRSFTLRLPGYRGGGDCIYAGLNNQSIDYRAGDTCIMQACIINRLIIGSGAPAYMQD